MPPTVATFVFLGFILWLFRSDAKQSEKPSAASWVPLIWTCIIASKPISLWFGLTQDLGSTKYVEDSLLDKLLFIILLVAAVVILWRRSVNLRSFAASNRWLFVFFLYSGIKPSLVR